MSVRGCKTMQWCHNSEREITQQCKWSQWRIWITIKRLKSQISPWIAELGFDEARLHSPLIIKISNHSSNFNIESNLPIIRSVTLFVEDQKCLWKIIFWPLYKKKQWKNQQSVTLLSYFANSNTFPCIKLVLTSIDIW